MTLSRVQASDAALATVMAAICAIIGGAAIGQPALGPQLLLHLGFLGAFLVLLAGAARGWVHRAVTVIASVLLVVLLYTSVGQVSFAVQGRSWDAALAGLDRALFGISSPEIAIGPAGVELMSCFYLFHLASIYIALGVYAVGRGARHREQFLLGLVLTYGLAYLGYLLVPAHGPIAFHATEYAGELRGGPIFRLTQQVVEAGGGAIGAFPSLHVGGTFFLFLFDLRHDRFRAATYVPVVVGVALSTVFLRFHYVVDWVGGAAIAAFAAAITPRALAAWARFAGPARS